MKKAAAILLSSVFCLGAASAQATGGDKKRPGKAPAADASSKDAAKMTAKSVKGGEKGHKGGKKSKKSSGGSTTPPPK